MNWIQGDKFIEIADFIYAPSQRSKDDYGNLVNTLNLHNVKNGDIIYTHTMYVKELFKILSVISGRVTVISHNSDINVDATFEIPNSVEKWYTQNINRNNPKIESIPIGLENDRWFKGMDKKGKMLSKLKEDHKWIDLLYVNHNVSTNPVKREGIYRLFNNVSFATCHQGKNGTDFDGYLNNLYNHRFMICPEGNGMDTHRTWECLYMGAIPVEKRNINNQFYTDLPICFVDDWDEITEDFLVSELRRIVQTDWDMKKLDFEYWKNKITC